MGESGVILALDVGLTNCKSVVFAETGEILGQSSVAYPTIRRADGSVEQDPEDWWKAACRATRDILDNQPDLAAYIDGISVTGHMHALVILGSDGSPLMNAIVLGDKRSEGVARTITHEMEMENIYRITGARMEADMPVAKIRWLQTDRPEIFKSADLFTGCKDYVRGRMTGGDRFTDPIDACAMSLYDLTNRSWAMEMMDAAGVSGEVLPEIVPSTSRAGSLQLKAAKQLGLRDGIPVVVGGGDDIEVLGAGLMSPGNSKEHLGTTGSFLTCSSKPVFDSAMSLELYPHADPELWVIGGSITSAGAALAWVARLLGYEDIGDVLRSEIDILQNNNIAPLVFIPHLTGERCPNWNPLARGAFLGLSAAHSNEDLIRACFEGTAYALNSILNRVEALVGRQHQILVADRTAESTDWVQLRANIYNRQIGVLNTEEPTALGAMILAAVGVGLFSDIREAVGEVTGSTHLIIPDPGKVNGVAKRFHLYEESHRLLQELWSVMDQESASPSSEVIHDD